MNPELERVGLTPNGALDSGWHETQAEQFVELISCDLEFVGITEIALHLPIRDARESSTEDVHRFPSSLARRRAVRKRQLLGLRDPNADILTVFDLCFTEERFSLRARKDEPVLRRKSARKDDARECYSRPHWTPQLDFEKEMHWV